MVVDWNVREKSVMFLWFFGFLVETDVVSRFNIVRNVCFIGFLDFGCNFLFGWALCGKGQMIEGSRCC